MTTETTTRMTVGELARRTGVSIKLLRDYTDWGLIDSMGRSAAGYRLYTTNALWCVQAISQLRGLGLTLAEIRGLVSAYPDRNGQLIGPRLAQRLRAARARVEQQITQLEQTRRSIESFEAAHHAELAGQRGSERWSSDAECCA